MTKAPNLVPYRGGEAHLLGRNILFALGFTNFHRGTLHRPLRYVAPKRVRLSLHASRRAGRRSGR